MTADEVLTIATVAARVLAVVALALLAAGLVSFGGRHGVGGACARLPAAV
jgi:hypothetical protein